MTIAEKLTTIAENMLNIADRFEGIDISTVGFDNWHTGTSSTSYVTFEHKLGIKPRFVAFIPNDITALETAELPSEVASIICQADGLYNPDTDTYCPANFIRLRDGAFASSSRNVNDGSNRLIVGWDDKYVYVNSNGSTEAWVPSSISTYTMICVK